MSKRAEEAALRSYPVHSVLIHPARRGGYYADNHLREGFIQGYKQAEKDTIKRAVKWLKIHTFMFDNVEQIDIFHDLFRKAMEEE